MLSGEYNHSIDPKSRLFMPAKLREVLGTDMVIVKNVDKCVSVYPKAAWGVFEEKLAQLPEIQARDIKRFLYSSANDVQPDSQGRILIPQKLREYASLDKNVTIIGAGDHVEIWNDETWEKKVNGEDNEKIVEMMISLGL
ncbi:MAG: division/cell wall cluster transcriptional repressor MraZ [Ruminococcaceae bacterium]|nr:division/cell wall cluster transcriptional repressor MraZ [Oscillospiraceae bacterium]